MEMEQIAFSAGTEKKFFDFISRLNDKDKIALISHTDLDGVASARVCNEIIGADILKFVDYIDINEELVRELKNKKVTKTIFVDLDFTRAEIVRLIEEFAEVLIIDHHIFSQDLNSNKTVFLSADGYCSSYICYYLFSKVEEISKFDWLVAAASLSDFCYRKNFEWLMKIKEKYGDKFSVDKMARVSRISDLADKLSLTLVYFRGETYQVYRLLEKNINDLGNLDNYAKDVQREMEGYIPLFEREKKISGKGEVYFWEFAPEFFIKSILINNLSTKYQDKTIVIIENNGRYFEVSVRRQDGKVNIVEMLKKLTYGLKATSGGHIYAAGASILPGDIAEFRERVGRL